MSLPNINNLTEQQLLELNNKIVDRIKELRRQQSRKNKQSLHVGQKVSFKNYQGLTLTGSIVKVKRTRAIVEVSSGNLEYVNHTTRWDVALNMLNPID